MSADGRPHPVPHRRDDLNRHRMAAVTWPGRRGDVVNALSILAALRPHGTPSWPGLTEAVHWLLDDTFWDQHRPHHDVGTILADTAEADAITATLAPMSAVLDELGPVTDDDDYLAHPRWPEVTRAATDAYRLMTGRARPGPEHP